MTGFKVTPDGMNQGQENAFQNESYEVENTVHRPINKQAPGMHVPIQQQMKEEIPQAPAPRSRTDPKYTDVSAELPSGFMFNSFDGLSIRTLELAELKKIFRANASDSLRTLVEAIGATVDQDIFQLTAGDFWFLMYWQRINSYKKSPLVVNFKCHDEKHNLDVNMGDKPESTLENQLIIDRSVLEMVYPDGDAIVAYCQDVLENGSGLFLRPATIGDLVEAEEFNIKTGGEITPEDRWMIKYASNISQKYGLTLKERCDFLEKKGFGPELVTEIEGFIKLAQHGVKEKVNVTCKECGAKREVNISINALTFFPDLFGTNAQQHGV